ncbi:unnamed protein product [Candida parapsilosis]
MSEKVSYRIPLDDLKLENKQFSSKDDIKPWLSDVLLRKKGIHIVIERSDATKIIFKCKNKEKKTKIIESKNKNTKIPIRRHTSCPFKIRANLSTRQKIWSISVIDDRHDHVVDCQEKEESPSPKVQTRELQPCEPQRQQQQPQSGQQQQQPPSLSTIGTGLNLSRSNMDKKSKLESEIKNNDKSSSTNTDQSSSVSAFSHRSSDEFRDSPPTSLNSIGEDTSTGTEESSSTSGNSTNNSISLPKKRKLHSTKGYSKNKKAKEELPTDFVEVPRQAARKSISKRDLNKDSDGAKKQRRRSAQESTQQEAPHEVQGSAKSPQNPKREQLRSHVQRSNQNQYNGQVDQFFASHPKAQVLPIPKPQSQSKSLNAMQALQNEVRQKIKYYILDNRNITDNQKTAMLDSFVSQLLIEYKNSFSPQFLESLRQNLYGRDNMAGGVQGSLSGYVDARNFQQNGSINQPPLNKKAALNNWLLSGLNDSSGSGLPGSTIPLSPLLNDNDSVYAAAAAAAAAGVDGVGGVGGVGGVDGSDGLHGSSLENLSSAPPIASQASNGSGYANQSNGGQLPQIQNQGQQLPPINSIQNKILSNEDSGSNGNISLDSQSSTNNILNNLSTNGTSFAMGNAPGLGVNFGPSNGSTNASANGSTRNSGNFTNPSNSLSSSSFFGNTSTGNMSLMPPLNSSTSTLNPSHILKNSVGGNSTANGVNNNQMINGHGHSSQTNGNSNNPNLTPLGFSLGKNINSNSFMAPNASQYGGYNGNANGGGNNNNSYLFASPSTNPTNQSNGNGIGNGDKDQGMMLGNLSNYDPGW